jgi:outer membrane protein TolC
MSRTLPRTGEGRGRIAFCLAVLLCAGRPQAPAQTDTTYLTLEECIAIARDSGPGAAMARRAFDAARGRHRSVTASFLPQLSLQADAPGYYRSINSITLPDGTVIFSPQSQATSSVNLSLSQSIPFTGGNLTFLSGLDRIDILDTDEKYYRSNPLTVSFRQPVFQINAMKWDLEADDLRYRIAEREAAEGMEEVALDVTAKYFDCYLSSMDIRNAEVNLANNDTLYRISKGRYNVGRIAENDLLQSELAWLSAKTQLENARLEYVRARAALRTVLGKEIPGEIALGPPGVIPGGWIDSSAALAEAARNRSDILGLELAGLASDRAVAQARSDNLFNATISASLGFNQRASTVHDVYRNLLDQQQFSVRLEVPLYRWGAGSAAIEAAESERERTGVSVARQRQELEQETLYEVARLNLLRLQVAVAAKADTIARRRFDVAKDRYLIGKIDIPILFIAQDEKDGALRAHIQTLRDCWTSYFRVRRLTLYDFAAGRPLIGAE